MKLSSTWARDIYDRIETVNWVIHLALMAYARYKIILCDKEVFSAVFPGVCFLNPKINHKIGTGIEFKTSKKEIIDNNNYDLFKAFQIMSGIVNMTSILEYGLKSILIEFFNVNENRMGIFYRFSDHSGININKYEKYNRLRHYVELRNICLHNLSYVNKRFKEKTAEQSHSESPYVFYPGQLNEYREVVGGFLEFLEDSLPKTDVSAISPEA